MNRTDLIIRAAAIRGRLQDLRWDRADQVAMYEDDRGANYHGSLEHDLKTLVDIILGKEESEDRP